MLSARCKILTPGCLCSFFVGNNRVRRWWLGVGSKLASPLRGVDRRPLAAMASMISLSQNTYVLSMYRRLRVGILPWGPCWLLCVLIYGVLRWNMLVSDYAFLVICLPVCVPFHLEKPEAESSQRLATVASSPRWFGYVEYHLLEFKTVRFMSFITQTMLITLD